MKTKCSLGTAAIFAIMVACSAIAAWRFSKWQAAFMEEGDHNLLSYLAGPNSPLNATAEYFTEPAILSFCRAIESRDYQSVEWHLNNGVDVNYTGKHGATPLLWALLHRRKEFYVELMRFGASPDRVTTGEITYLSRTIATGDSFLIAAAKQMQLAGVVDAVPFSRDLNHKDASGTSFLPPFIFHTSFRDEDLPSEDLRADFEKMIRHGLDVNMRHERGSTALHIAFKYNPMFAILLLESNADPTISNDAGILAIDGFFKAAEFNPSAQSLTAIFGILQKQGHVDDHLTMIEAIRERNPDWVPRQDLSGML